MAPKKVAAASAEKKVNDVPAAVETKAKPKVKPKVTKLTTPGHPSTLAMVVEVLKKNSEQKGTSVQAIRSRILAAHPTVDPVRLKFLLRSALNKGLEKGLLIRPLNSSAIGATGRFKLAKPGPKSKAEGGDKMSENVDPNVQPKEETKEKAKKVVKKVPKKPKLKAEKETNGDEEVKASDKKEKTPEAKAAASKLKKDAAEKTEKAPAPTKKPKSKTPAAEEGTKPKKEPAAEEGTKPKKEPAKKKAEPSKAKDSEEKLAAKAGKKGKK